MGVNRIQGIRYNQDVDRLPPTAELHGNRYPWDDWIARPLPLVLRRGVDYSDHVKSSSMGVMLRLQIIKRGLYRTICVTDDAVTMGPKTDFRGAKRRATTRKTDAGRPAPAP